LAAEHLVTDLDHPKHWDAAPWHDADGHLIGWTLGPLEGQLGYHLVPPNSGFDPDFVQFRQGCLELLGQDLGLVTLAFRVKTLCSECDIPHARLGDGFEVFMNSNPSRMSEKEARRFACLWLEAYWRCLSPGSYTIEGAWTQHDLDAVVIPNTRRLVDRILHGKTVRRRPVVAEGSDSSSPALPLPVVRPRTFGGARQLACELNNTFSCLLQEVYQQDVPGDDFIPCRVFRTGKSRKATRDVDAFTAEYDPPVCSVSTETSRLLTQIESDRVRLKMGNTPKSGVVPDSDAHKLLLEKDCKRDFYSNLNRRCIAPVILYRKRMQDNSFSPEFGGSLYFHPSYYDFMMIEAAYAYVRLRDTGKYPASWFHGEFLPWDTSQLNGWDPGPTVWGRDKRREEEDSLLGLS